MIEPPQAGFTGVVWEAREPDKLARDLTTGAGSVAMAEAGGAWARLAAGLGAAAVEYEIVLTQLRGAWQSGASEDVHERITVLRDWLSDTAGAAANNAARAEAQAAAYELARMTMPNIAEIVALQDIQRSIEQFGAMLGAPIRAVAAVTDTDTDAAKATASRVMRTYEAATEPLALPWAHADPPVLTAGTSLAAEQTGGPAIEPAAAATGLLPMPLLPSGFPPGGFPMPAPVKTAYRASLPVQTTQTTEVPVTQQVSTSSPYSSTAPGAMGPAGAGGVSAQGEEEHRAGIAVEGADTLGLEGGIVSAPAVLGAPSGESAAPRGTTEPGAAR
ncbi:PPE domain-containing protein [Nocardia sp. NPDC051570]|uniref:PPE domain-containing protein n=1 Tax=Nocardia sp. NPDC051570 TaxID=3364324 RepID=UPI0037B1230E